MAQGIRNIVAPRAGNIDSVQGVSGVGGGGSAGDVSLYLDLPLGLDLGGNTQTTTPPTASATTSRRIATVQYVRAAIDAYGGATGGGTWGSITGTLAAQTDLHTALNGKQPLTGTATTPPANPVPGQQWFDPASTQLFVWFNDGTSSQWVVVVNPRVIDGVFTVDTVKAREIIVGTPTGGDKGPGTISVEHGIYVNGEPLSSVDTVAVGLHAAGNNHINALALTRQFNEVVNVAANTGVRLPDSGPGEHCFVRNSGNAALTVYPPSGKRINRQSIDAGIFVPEDTTAYFKCVSGVQWYTVP